MLVWWSEKIPYVSTPADIGSMFYLGPYLNVFPIIAVGLMIYQQNKMMPPPTDEQMAAQQRMMKFMMILVAVMFYKVAAGLALYFIVTTLWGVVERRLIPKAKDKGDDSGSGAKLPQKGGSPNGTAAEYSAAPASCSSVRSIVESRSATPGWRVQPGRAARTLRRSS